ncbi:hypothetical protein [Haloarcula marismortui]|uniref:Uncharacterized protein n=1 Tax=Haloarcula marismortui ATCC 33800 TaxID=662476 RepID=A0A8T8KCJ8_9EURY|nr:hypothetical protein [Haloarcula sinaiiensis]QUJ71941.1 hypothetical protein KDQ40_14805 [Haloarcula sinaiiensis ATCC 33800]
MDNKRSGYLDVDISIQGDVDQLGTQMAEELYEEGLGSPEYTASFLATADYPSAVPQEVLKRNVWIGVRAENPDIDSISESDFGQQESLSENNSKGGSEDDFNFGYVAVRGSIEKYLDKAVPAVNSFERYETVLDNAGDDFTVEEAAVSYFVTGQATGSELSETIDRLEESGVAGLKIEAPDRETSWHIFDVESDSFFEVPEVTAKYNSDL